MNDTVKKILSGSKQGYEEYVFVEEKGGAIKRVLWHKDLPLEIKKKESGEIIPIDEIPIRFGEYYRTWVDATKLNAEI